MSRTVLAHCDGYSWDMKSLLGKGSYGNVYRGTNNGRTVEVAVKVVRKDLFRQDLKAEQNLMREIDILKKLRSCEYVVHLYHVQDMARSDAIVLVMELCECDLDHLIKVKPFNDKDIVVLLHQLGEGMKALRAHNIVHRDIKPGNILIKYHPKTGKMMIKLADFGFARHFTDESMKPLDLTSLAGTPVFMAPEALKCVFNPGVEHYDDKVDLWSIGALVYKVLVGQCGFYAQLNHILPLLENKGDAIAWEPSTAPNYSPVPKVKYVKELPPSVDQNLSPPFKQKMNHLLKSLLKLDPLERMTYPEFFDFMDDLIKSKVEVFNLLHGTAFKFMLEPGIKVDDLRSEIELAVTVPTTDQIIFSSQSDLFISKNSNLSDKDFNMFMNRAGGSQGHAVIYLVAVNEISASLIEPDYGVVAKLFYCVENRPNCVKLITEHKYSDEIVHSIGLLQKQIERQFSCIQEFRSFCTKQLEILHESLGDTREKSQETLAKTSMAVDWLIADLDTINKGGGFNQEAVKTFKNNVDKLKMHKMEIESLVRDMEVCLSTCENAILKAPSLEINDLIENSKRLTAEAKALSTVRKDFMYQKCEELLQYCKGLIVSSSERAHKMLKGLHSALSNVWSVVEKLEKIKRKKEELEDLLKNKVPQWKSDLLKSVQHKAVNSTPSQGWSQLQQELASKNELLRKIEAENLQLQEQLKDQKLVADGTLVQKLKTFCLSAKKFIGKSPSPTEIESQPLHPHVNEKPVNVSDSLHELLPEASLHLDNLAVKLRDTTGLPQGTIDEMMIHIKITQFDKYVPGDVVLFHPVGVGPSAGGGNVQLNLTHLKKPRPYGILQPECYAAFGFRVGRIADLVIAILEKLPEEASFKDNPALAKELGEIDGSERKYFRVWAKPAGIDFLRKQTRTSSGFHKAPPSTVPANKKNSFI